MFAFFFVANLVEVAAIQVKIEWHKIRWGNGNLSRKPLQKWVANAKTWNILVQFTEIQRFSAVDKHDLVCWEMINMVLKASAVLSYEKADNQVNHGKGYVVAQNRLLLEEKIV